MLNINQNFDLKAPVFNFDRDYFNSVEELKAYDTSNVPNHFVTNVAGTLYQLTGGNWVPMIGTDYDADRQMQTLKIANENCLVQLIPSQQLYQYGVATSYSTAVMNSWAQVVLYSEVKDMPPYLKITLTDKINYSKSILCGQDDSPFGLTIKDLSNHSASMFIDEDNPNGSSPVGITLIDNDFSTKINAQDGFVHKTDDDFISGCTGYTLYTKSENKESIIDISGLSIMNDAKNVACIQYAHLDKDYKITLGSNEKFKIYGSDKDTNGTTITGVESITAFSNPSATKVWATDGSTVNMPTKFSDLKNDSIYITGNKGETNAKFKIEYKEGDVSRSKLIYTPRHAGVGIPELALVSYDTSGHNLSQLRIRPDDNRDNGQYLIQVQNVIGDTINYVSTLATENVSLQNFKNNTSVDLKSDELDFYNDPQGEQIQLKVNKEGITKTNGKPTEVFATDGSTVDLSTYTNYFNGTTTADKLKAKAVEVTDNTNSVTVSPTGITATNGSATKVFATDGSIADLSTKANASDLGTKANKSDVLLKKNSMEGYYIEDSKGSGRYAFSINYSTNANGPFSFAEGFFTKTERTGSHAEGSHTIAVGNFSHAQGVYNVGNANAIHSVGIGTDKNRKTAEYIYAVANEFSYGAQDDPKNGYKYLIGVGGYDGISIDDSTYKSVQEVIADLTTRIEQLETKVKALEDANNPA